MIDLDSESSSVWSPIESAICFLVLPAFLSGLARQFPAFVAAKFYGHSAAIEGDFRSLKQASA